MTEETTNRIASIGGRIILGCLMCLPFYFGNIGWWNLFGIFLLFFFITGCVERERRLLQETLIVLSIIQKK